MVDLPDYYTQIVALEAEAFKLRGGADASKSADPTSRDVYFATDTQILYVCVVDGVWTGFDAATLTEGILTLYANLAGGGFQIKNIADPTAAQDAATRAYVLAQVALRLALTGGTMSGNIIMGGNKLTGLGAPAAAGDSLRYGNAEIRNAEIAAAAAIAYSKLSLTGNLVVADLTAALINAANGLVQLDASADVPDAQIPNLAAGKITSNRFPVDRLPAMTDEKIWKGTGANVEEVDIPIVTKEFFVPVTYGTELVANRAFPGALINATADVAYMVFYVPDDFTAITEAVVVRYSLATATHRFNYESDYGASGASFRSHEESLSDQDTAETANIIYEQDISGILSVLAVGDYVGIKVLGDATNTPNDYIIGVRFKYS